MSNLSKFASLISRQKESGLTVRMFCSNEGIAESSFYYWQNKIKKEAEKRNFIPLVIKTPNKPPHPANQEPIQHICDGFLMEISYPNGIKLRIKNDLELERLRTLISLMD